MIPSLSGTSMALMGISTVLTLYGMNMVPTEAHIVLILRGMLMELTPPSSLIIKEISMDTSLSISIDTIAQILVLLNISTNIMM